MATLGQLLMAIGPCHPEGAPIDAIVHSGQMISEEAERLHRLIRGLRR